MSRSHGDIDIDVFDRDKVLEHLKYTSAMIVRNDTGVLQKHNTGVYFQDIPFDPYTGMSTIEYREADALGYYKIDILNNSVYSGVRNESHLNELLNMEPDWDKLLDHTIVEQLAHIKNHYSIVNKYKPSSIEDLAIVLAIIRPAKIYLQDYSWDYIKEHIWDHVDSGYAFKKSHAIAYATSIIVQMNLLLSTS